MTMLSLQSVRRVKVFNETVFFIKKQVFSDCYVIKEIIFSK